MIEENPARAGALLLTAGVVLLLAVWAAAKLGGFNPILLPGLVVIGAVLCLVGIVLVVRGLSRKRARGPATPGNNSEGGPSNGRPPAEPGP